MRFNFFSQTRFDQTNGSFLEERPLSNNSNRKKTNIKEKLALITILAGLLFGSPVFATDYHIDGGVHSFSEGIDTSEGGNLLIENNAQVTFENGAITTIGGDFLVESGSQVALGAGSTTFIQENFSLSGTSEVITSLLKIELNDLNKVNLVGDTLWNEGATQFRVDGVVDINEFGSLEFEINNARSGSIYLAAVGDFSLFSDAMSVLINGKENLVSYSSRNDGDGLWFTITDAGFFFIRKNAAGVIQHESDLFNEVFEQQSGYATLSTGDQIVLRADASTTAAILIGAAVESLTIGTGDSQLHTITATGNDHRLITIEESLTLTLNQITLSGGRSTTSGGAIFAQQDLTLIGNATFLDNSTIQDHRGGAIFINEGSLIFSGNSSNFTFSGNKVGNVNNDICLGSSDGEVLIKDAGTYTFGGGIDASSGGRLTISGTANVTFGEDSITHIAGLTTLLSNNVTFEGETMLSGGLLVGAGVTQGFSGTTSLDGELALIYNQSKTSNQFGKMIASTSNVTIEENATAALYDVNGNKLTATDFKGTEIAIDLIRGHDNQVAHFSTETYHSLLYDITLGVKGQNWGLYATKQQFNPNDYEGNYAATANLYGEGAVFDVQTLDEARDHVYVYSREGIAHHGEATVNQISYMNTLLVNRMMIYGPNAVKKSSIFRGQANHASSFSDSWFGGYGLENSVEANSGFGNYDHNAWGFLCGMDRQSITTRLGGYFGYGQSKTTSFGSNIKSNDFSMGLTLRHNDRFGYSTLLGGLQFNSLKGTHDLPFWEGASNNPSYFTWNMIFYGERGMLITCPWNGQFNPYGAIQYIGYRGKGFEDYDMEIIEQKQNSFQTVLGIRYNQKIILGKISSLWNVGTSWHHETGSAGHFLAKVGENKATIYGNMAGRDWVEITTGFAVDFTDRITVGGDYSMMANANSSLNAGMGTITIRF